MRKNIERLQVTEESGDKLQADETFPSEPERKTLKKKKRILRWRQVIWYVTGVIEVLLAFRLLLKLMGASSFSIFANLVYSLSEPFAYPFVGVVRSTVNLNYIIEWSTLIALAVYPLLALGLVSLLTFIKPVTREEIEEKVEEV